MSLDTSTTPSTTTDQPQKKVYIKTYGCQMNEYDSDKMSDVMNAAKGYVPTNDPEEADLILFNTCSIREKAQEKVFSDLGRVKHRKEGASAFVSIMEGCSKYCSYCVVPYTRGEEVSRPFDDVLTEVADLADQGVKEVTLLGQNVNGYRGNMGDTAEIADFAMLLEYVAEIPGIERIRFTTSHPNEFSQRLIDVYGKTNKLVNHVHLPVQHGSDRILMAMKRGYTTLEYKSTIRKLRAVRPDIRLSTDFIVGFPGETDDDFDKLMKLAMDIEFV